MWSLAHPVDMAEAIGDALGDDMIDAVCSAAAAATVGVADVHASPLVL